MDQLVEMVAQKSGITHDQARRTVETVLDYVKKQLPGPVAAQVQTAIKGDLGGLQGMLGGLGGGLGKK